jgi:DNA mismatch repair protein MSH2
MTSTVFRQFLRDCLFKNGKRIEIWTNTTGRMSWALSKRASAGNIQDVEDDLGGDLETAPIILAFKVSTSTSLPRSIGVCFADASSRDFGICVFDDNDLYSNLESLIIQLGVKECLIPSTADTDGRQSESNKIKRILANCDIIVSERPPRDYATKDVEVDLQKLFIDEQSTKGLIDSELQLAMPAACALIKYLDILRDPADMARYRFHRHSLEQYMKLDAAALRALNLVPQSTDASNTMSVYGVLNHCKLPNGSRLLLQWLKQPLMDKSEIDHRQELVAAFVEHTQLRQSMREDHLRLIPDIHRLCKKFEKNKATLEDVVRVYQVILRLPGLLNALDGFNDTQYSEIIKTSYVDKVRSFSQSFGKFQELVETTVQLEAIDKHDYIIKPEFDDRLNKIRRKLDVLDVKIRQEFRDAAHDLGQEPERKIFLENHRTHGWCLRLTRSEAGCIRNLTSYQECSTQKNGVYFTTHKMQTLRREFDQLSHGYHRSQSSLVDEVVTVAATYCPALERLANMLAHLDVIVSLAHAAVNAPIGYVRPLVHERGEGKTVLTESRHPCMELQDSVNFISNDVTLTRDKSSFLIITGPNMGGKSTYIRQVGVIALMAQIGSFVPCRYAETTIFDSILARVGASDSQIKGVSTFMAEMIETANILQSATSESLIIIDELGRGTSTYDGFGLAWAISERIINEIRCYAMFATHFHELTTLSHDYPSVTNMHVAAHVNDDSTLQHTGRRDVTLLYKVEPGVCDRSFGIHVAELVRFPAKVIDMARRKADELEDFAIGVNSHNTDIPIEPALLVRNQKFKQLLITWKQTLDTTQLTHSEIVSTMRTLARDASIFHDQNVTSN